MENVTARLDGHFSEPGARRPRGRRPSGRCDAQLFWISTVRRDSRPHVTPLVAVWDDEALYFCTGPEAEEGGQPRGEPAGGADDGLQRLAGRPRRGRRGRGRACGRRGQAEQAGACVARKVGRLLENRTDRRRFPPGGDGIAHVFAVRPTKVLAFGKGGFSHTRHGFPSSSGG